MKRKIFVFIFILSIVINIVTIFTFGYLWASNRPNKKTEKYEIDANLKKSIWMVTLKLDVPGLDPQAVQYAFFNYDPMPDYYKRVKSSSTHYNSMQQRAKDDEQKQGFRRAAIRQTWENSFADITGDEVFILNDMSSSSSNGPSGMQWIVTKLTYLDKEPICWCVPVQPEIGEEKIIVLSRDNMFNVSQAFDETIASCQGTTETQYPADSNYKDDLNAHRLYDNMLNILKKAKTLYYESTYWFGPEGAEALKENTYRVWLKKPKYSRMEAAINNKITGTLVGDGNFLWIYWGDKDITFDGINYRKYNNKTYMKIPVIKGNYLPVWLSQKLQAGMATLTLNPCIFYGTKIGLDEYMDGVMNRGSEVVNGENCDIIEVSYNQLQRSHYYWISRNDHLPRKIVCVVRVHTNIISKEIWTNVLVNMDISNTLFSWTPPEGWTQYFEPELDKNLLEKGTTAPDFELKTIDSNRIRLSELQGKVVLLYFWQVEKIQYTEEIDLFQKLYDKYGKKGFVIIGINAADDYNTALNYLKNNAITYPNIIDASVAAQDVGYRLYTKPTTRSASPMSYLIGRDGKIADAWYGFKESRLVKNLKSLGFE